MNILGWLFGKDKRKYEYPKNIESLCKSMRDEAKKCIASKGYKITEKADLKLEVVKGQKNIKGYWSWKSPEWGGMWVCGLTYTLSKNKYLIKVGCNPANSKEVNPAAIKHEHGHFWCSSCLKIEDHNPRFASCFANWNDVKVKSFKALTHDGLDVIVDYIEEDL